MKLLFVVVGDCPKGFKLHGGSFAVDQDRHDRTVSKSIYILALSARFVIVWMRLTRHEALTIMPV